MQYITVHLLFVNYGSVFKAKLCLGLYKAALWIPSEKLSENTHNNIRDNFMDAKIGSDAQSSDINF